MALRHYQPGAQHSLTRDLTHATSLRCRGQLRAGAGQCPAYPQRARSQDQRQRRDVDCRSARPWLDPIELCATGRHPGVARCSCCLTLLGRSPAGPGLSQQIERKLPTVYRESCASQFTERFHCTQPTHRYAAGTVHAPPGVSAGSEKHQGYESGPNQLAHELLLAIPAGKGSGSRRESGRRVPR